MDKINLQVQFTFFQRVLKVNHVLANNAFTISNAMLYQRSIPRPVLRIGN